MEVSMSQENEHRLRFRDAMASLSAAVNIVTTDGPAGRCGITATAVCSVTDTPPTLMVCINRNSAMNPVFQGNQRLCVNVLNHEQEQMARHFAGMTEVSMEERFRMKEWQSGPFGQPVLRGTLASLEGEIEQMQSIGTHQMYLVQIKQITLSEEGHGLIYFKRRFHPVMHAALVKAANNNAA
jgi:flavin reductase (NADH)